jgi:coenzyme F420-reducing hydrogenase beta subunit
MNTYIVKHKDLETRIKSRSGGVFTALSDVILNQGGIVYGAAMINPRQVEHIRAETKDARDRMRGSKYIQSTLKNVFPSIKKDVKNGKLILFSGTGCQIAAVKMFLEGQDTSKVFYVEIVCHGVPSNRVWSDYCDYIERAKNQKIEKIDFRNKEKFGWAAHYETFYFSDGSNLDSSLFRELFYEHQIIRPSCYACPYKKPQDKQSDITIADAWGIDKETRPFNDDNGVSLVLTITEKGQSLFDIANKDVDSLSCEFQKYTQPPLIKPFPEPKGRKAFWRFYRRHKFESLIKWHKRKVFRDRVEEKLLSLIHRGKEE